MTVQTYSIKHIILSTIVGVLVGAGGLYLLTDHPSSNTIDPRCDPLFIKNVHDGQRQCNIAREQRAALDYMKNPNGD